MGLMEIFFVKLVVVGSVLVTCNALLLPSYFPRCPQIYTEEEMPAYRKCISQASEKSRKILEKGIPEFRIPSVKGFVIPGISIEQKSRAFEFNVALSNVTIFGLENYKDVISDFNPTTGYLNASISFSFLEVIGNFHVVGRVFSEPINQTGSMEVKLENSNAIFDASTKFVTKRGKKFIFIKKYDYDVIIGNSTGDFGNLFGKNEVLNKATKSLLEQSLNEVILIAIPQMKKSLAGFIDYICEKIVFAIPYDNIFPAPPSRETET